MTETPLPRLPQPSPDQLREFVRAKRLLRAIRAGALATLDDQGRPFATLVNVATAHDGAPILLMSTLAAHTRNSKRAASLDPARPDRQGRSARPSAPDRAGNAAPGSGPRAARPLSRPSSQVGTLRRLPRLLLLADARHRLPSQRRLCARRRFRAGSDPRRPRTAPTALRAAEADAIEHLNGDHADALRLYAAKLDGQPDARWHATGIDPDGLDLAAGDRTSRIAFPSAHCNIRGDLRAVLVALAAQARAAGAAIRTDL